MQQIFGLLLLTILAGKVEVQTPATSCPGMIECADGNGCYKDYQKCNDEADCEDGSDEKACSCDDYSKKKCWDGRCIDRFSPCSKWDCEFRSCNDLSRCYDYYEECNDYETCGDGTDEQGCEGKVEKRHWTWASWQDWDNWSSWYIEKRRISKYDYDSSSSRHTPGWIIFVAIFGAVGGVLFVGCGIRVFYRKLRRNPSSTTPDADQTGTTGQSMSMASPEPRDPIVDLPPDYHEAITDTYKPPSDHPDQTDKTQQSSNIDESGLPSYDHAITTGMASTGAGNLQVDGGESTRPEGREETTL